MASKYAGYMGKMLDVNLSTGQISNYEISDTEREQFLGGKCLAAKILWDTVRPGVDAFSPDNVLVFTTGPMTGSGAPLTSRFNCSTKSPLTGGITSSNSGGDFGIRLKRAGYDGLILRGRAPHPTWLHITDENVELKDATELWGKDTEEVQKDFKRKTGILVIGPAGENLVRFACIMSGERCLGRGGVGAVMGSKNLKLVTAEGNQKMTFHDEKGFRELVKFWVGYMKDHTITGQNLPKFGTAGLMNPCNATYTLGTHNFKYGRFDSAHKVSGETLADKHLTKNWGCTSCTIQCARQVEYNGQKIKGPEYETMGMFGPMIENDNLESIIEWNYLCDLYGMDTISAGSTIACAMELKERGHLTGLSKVAFGQYEGINKLLKDIAYRKGIGNDLAEGATRLAIACGDPNIAMQSKGLEFAIYEPRSSVGHGLGYATSNRGGCHINGGYLIYLEAVGPITMDPYTTKGKPALAVMQQNLLEAVSASTNCIFTTYSIFPDAPDWMYNPHGTSAWVNSEMMKLLRFVLNWQGRMSPGMLPVHVPTIPQSKLISLLTGMNMHLGNFLAAGERGFTMERLFNMREGMLKEHDALPPRLTDVEQRPNRPESKVPLAKMLPEYYSVRDWDENGIPRARLLKKLGMTYAITEADQIRQNQNQYRERFKKVRDAESTEFQKTLELMNQ